jgi:quercetin dioxygenase-like cupin family protein
MLTTRSRPLGRRQLVCGCCAGTLLAWVPARARAAEDAVVPVIEEPRHHTRFLNEYVRIIEAILVPGDITFYHRHSRDSVLIAARGVKMRVEQPGDPQAWIGEAKPGDVAYKNFGTHPLVHRVGNEDDHTALFFDCEINVAQPGQFAPPDRGGAPAYVTQIDNDRVRVWRLTLTPGQSVPPIRQSGPGVRVVLAGDRLTETLAGAPDRNVSVHQGSYEYQPAGRMRGLVNSGTSPLDLLEFEVK